MARSLVFFFSISFISHAGLWPSDVWSNMASWVGAISTESPQQQSANCNNEEQVFRYGNKVVYLDSYNQEVPSNGLAEGNIYYYVNFSKTSEEADKLGHGAGIHLEQRVVAMLPPDLSLAVEKEGTGSTQLLKTMLPGIKYEKLDDQTGEVSTYITGKGDCQFQINLEKEGNHDLLITLKGEDKYINRATGRMTATKNEANQTILESRQIISFHSNLVPSFFMSMARSQVKSTLTGKAEEVCEILRKKNDQ